MGHSSDKKRGAADIGVETPSAIFLRSADPSRAARDDGTALSETLLTQWFFATFF